MNPLLSILIPTVPERTAELATLLEILTPQTDGKSVEVLTFGDNRRRSIGLKRQALLDIARGKYVAFCDDDDLVSDDYVATLCEMAAVDVDVLCFNQLARWNGHESTVEFRVNHDPAGAFNPGGITKRFPWHVCAWRRQVAKQCVFTDKDWGEDADWVAQIHGLTRLEAYIDKTLHFYAHTDASSLALDNITQA